MVHSEKLTAYGDKKTRHTYFAVFAGPFFATFMIAIFVLTMQFFWLYIDDLVGKGLDPGTLAYLTGLVAVTWVPLCTSSCIAAFFHNDLWKPR